ncbi:MAG TPA: hypothetical protein VGH33_26520 [Isosphaeraceae bacterium]
MKRYLVGLLAAYAATTTLLAIHWSAEAWLYRRCFHILMQGKHGRPVNFPDLGAIYADFGLSDGAWAYWYLLIADSERVLTAVIGLLFACGLIFPKYLMRRRRRKADGA